VGGDNIWMRTLKILPIVDVHVSFETFAKKLGRDEGAILRFALDHNFLFATYPLKKKRGCKRTRVLPLEDMSRFMKALEEDPPRVGKRRPRFVKCLREGCENKAFARLVCIDHYRERFNAERRDARARMKVPGWAMRMT